MSEALVALAPHRGRCFGCGPAQPAGLGVALGRRGDVAVGEVTLHPRFTGPPGAAHGGVVAALLDEILGTAVASVGGVHAVTTQLETEFLAPVPIGAPIVIEAWIATREAERLETEGTISHEGAVLARGRATFLAIDLTRVVDGTREDAEPAAAPAPAGTPVVDPHAPTCFGCGSGNVDALGVRHRRDGEEIVSRVVFDRRVVGFPGIAHGGAIAVLLDDAMGVAPLALAGTLAHTRALTVRFRRPARIGTPLEVRTAITGREGRRIEVAATLRDDTRELAAATATFVVVA